MKWISQIVLFFIYSLASAALACASNDTEHIQHLSQDPQWLNLVHYKKTLTGNNKSISDPESGFFLSPHGHHDPKQELLATIDAFYQNKLLSTQGLLEKSKTTQAGCAFPARYLFLTQNGFRFPKPDCPELDEWIKKLDPKSVSLVFSSAYPGNPGSMLGHTFLRVKKHTSEQSDFLDTGISFAATIPPDENSFAYFWFGLTGGYQGTFSVLPYYVKIQEYVNFENRDLWEYPVQFSNNQTIFFLKHIWELHYRAHIKYYFFDENCSYILLAAIQAINPSYDLKSLGTFVIPGETVKKSIRQKAVSETPLYRPSQRHLVEDMYSSLNPDEQTLFWQYINKKTDHYETKPLDASLQYLLYKKQKGDLTDQNELSHQKHLLIARSKINERSTQHHPKESEPSTKPGLAHDPSRVDLGLGYKNSTFYSMRLKLAYHDLLDNDQGYNRFSQIDFPNFKLRFQNSKLSLDELPLIEVTSLYAQNKLFKGLSYKVQTGFYRPLDREINGSLTYTFQAGPGLAYEVFNSSVIYGFTLLGIDASSSTQDSIRFGPRLVLGLLTEPASKYKLSVNGVSKWQPFAKLGPRYLMDVFINHSFSLSQNLAFRLQHQRLEHEFSLLVYF